MAEFVITRPSPLARDDEENEENTVGDGSIHDEARGCLNRRRRAEV
jgi:hypothetical protein